MTGIKNDLWRSAEATGAARLTVAFHAGTIYTNCAYQSTALNLNPVQKGDLNFERFPQPRFRLARS